MLLPSVRLLLWQLQRLRQYLLLLLLLSLPSNGSNKAPPHMQI
jgi:hypothetical protein